MCFANRALRVRINSYESGDFMGSASILSCAARLKSPPQMAACGSWAGMTSRSKGSVPLEVGIDSMLGVNSADHAQALGVTPQSATGFLRHQWVCDAPLPDPGACVRTRQEGPQTVSETGRLARGPAAAGTAIFAKCASWPRRNCLTDSQRSCRRLVVSEGVCSSIAQFR